MSEPTQKQEFAGAADEIDRLTAERDRLLKGLTELSFISFAAAEFIDVLREENNGYAESAALQDVYDYSGKIRRVIEGLPALKEVGE